MGRHCLVKYVGRSQLFLLGPVVLSLPGIHDALHRRVVYVYVEKAHYSSQLILGVVLKGGVLDNHYVFGIPGIKDISNEITQSLHC